MEEEAEWTRRAIAVCCITGAYSSSSIGKIANDTTKYGIGEFIGLGVAN